MQSALSPGTLSSILGYEHAMNEVQGRCLPGAKLQLFTVALFLSSLFKYVKVIF